MLSFEAMSVITTVKALSFVYLVGYTKKQKIFILFYYPQIFTM